MVATPPQPTSVEIRPNVGMLALLSSMNYKPWYALSEFVDNAVASFLASQGALQAAHGQTCVTVDIRLDRSAGVIEVIDDAAGIAAADIARAFRPAEPPPDRTGLAQFGIGMKSAACWFSDRFTVSTTALGEPTRRAVEFDVPAIVRQQQETLPVVDVPAQPDVHGTVVRLESLHRPVPTGKTLGKVRKYLASIYRHYLRSGQLILIVGEEPLEAPEVDVLTAPRWDRARSSTAETWRKEVEIEPAPGCIVRGWLALRARGSTSESGLALIHRGKVVVGAGAGAGEADDLYRPPEIFGASTSFVFQRLVGELDVSALRVSYSKDAILWDGAELVFLERLREAADAEPMPLLRMGRLFRATERGVHIERQLTTALDATVEAAARYVSPAISDPVESQAAAPPREEVSRALRLSAPSDHGEVVLSVVLRDGSTWLRVLDKDGASVIELDREHPFMQAFAHLPHQQIEPILRLALAFGLAEIEARMSGVSDASAVRVHLNRILRGPLARTTVEAPT